MLSSFARVHKELHTEVSTGDGIHPTSARRNANGTTVPTTPAGHKVNVDRSACGSVTNAAPNVDRPRITRMAFTVKSKARYRPTHNSAAHAAIKSEAVTGRAHSSPNMNWMR